jgi:HK97 family phage major capsid protein
MFAAVRRRAAQIGKFHSRKKKMKFHSAGEKRKFYRNMRENQSARQIGVASLSLLMLLGPFAILLLIGFVLCGGSHLFSGHSGHAVGSLAAVAPVLVAGNIKLLRQRDHELRSEGMALINTAAEHKRGFTDDERKRIDAIKAEREVLAGDIERTEAFLDAERGATPTEPSKDKTMGFKNMGEQLQAIKTAAVSNSRVIDPRLNAGPQGANETVDSEGGFLIAPQYTEDLLQRTYDTGQVASRCYTQPMSSNRLVMNAVDEKSRVDGSRWGGLQAFWANEAGLYTGSKPKFRQIQLTANKLIGLVYATEEQLADGPALEAYIQRAVPNEFAFKIDDAIINGPGNGQPLGVLNSAAFIQTLKEGGQLTGTIVTNNILKMWKRMYGPSRQNAVWFINQDTEDQLYALVLGSGTAVQLLYTPPGTRGNQYGLLLGRPVIPIEQCQSLSTQGDIILADMSQYILGQRGGLRADSSMHVSFLTGENAFRFMLRLDGQPWWSTPLTPKNGANTQSPFIVLQSR